MGFDHCTFNSESLSDSTKLNYQKLRQAVRNKDSLLVKHLVENGATLVNVHYLETLYYTPLHLAVISRCPEIVGILLSAGANICAKSEDGETPLTLAAKIGDIFIIDLLLSLNPNYARNRNDGLSHLHIACMRNRIDLVKRFLLMKQWRVNASVEEDSMCWGGYTPLHFAVQYGCIETAKYLLDAGADLTAQDVREMTPLHIAHFHRNEELVDLLLVAHKFELKNPALHTSTGCPGLSHFHIACTRNDASVVEHFLKSGVDVNLYCGTRLWSGWQPIHFAVFYECPNVIELLLKTKVHLNDSRFFKLLTTAFSTNAEIYALISAKRISLKNDNEDLKRVSNLHLACLSNNTEIVHVLRGKGLLTVFELNERLWTESTPVHLAVKCKSVAVTDLLITSGADILVQDAQGKTPLHIALEHGEFELLKKMLHKLTNHTPNLMDDVSLSIFHILCTVNYLESIKDLKQLELIENFLARGIDINIQVGDRSTCWAGFTPLHFAVEYLQPEVVSLLLKNHADILIENALHQTPLDLLIDKMRTECNWGNGDPDRQLCEILTSILTSSREIGELRTRGFSPLHAVYIDSQYFSGEKYVDKLKLYLKSHRDEVNSAIDLPGSRDFHKSTPLHLVMKRHLFDAARILLRNGADPTRVNGIGKTPVEMAVSGSLKWGKVEKDIKFLFNLKMPVQEFKPSHFHLACGLGCLSVVRHVLKKAADEKLKMSFVNCRNDYGRTPLHAAIENRARDEKGAEITRLLLENGADVNARDCELQTPLHFGSDLSLQTLRHLISYGANVNAQNLYGDTPLHMIFAYRNPRAFMGRIPVEEPKVLALLLENGADINILDEQGRSWLMFDWGNYHQFDCVELLAKHAKRLMVLGYYVHDKNREAYANLLKDLSPEFNETVFVNDCKKEIESMKLTRVDRYTSLYNILFKTLNAMAFCCENTTLRELVASSEFPAKYPLYGFLIRLQLKNGRIRRMLLEKSKKSLVLLVGRRLPAVCAEAVLQYLDESDLKSIVSSLGETEI